jgi:hypothetical protein
VPAIIDAIQPASAPRIIHKITFIIIYIVSFYCTLVNLPAAAFAASGPSPFWVVLEVSWAQATAYSSGCRSPLGVVSEITRTHHAAFAASAGVAAGITVPAFASLCHMHISFYYHACIIRWPERSIYEIFYCPLDSISFSIYTV